jgi:hypothetical protein
MNPLSEVASDPRLRSIQIHPLENDYVRVVAVDADGNELARIHSVSGSFALPLVGDAGIALGSETVYQGGIRTHQVIPGL